jgi:hypothetical protein
MRQTLIILMATVALFSCAKQPIQNLPKYKGKQMHQRKALVVRQIDFPAEAQQSAAEAENNETLVYAAAELDYAGVLPIYKNTYVPKTTERAVYNNRIAPEKRPAKYTYSPKLERKIAKLKEKISTKNLKPKPNTDGFQSLDRNLKIGIVLIAIGLGLSILGLGQIGGLAALIGLVFLVLGLLNTY